MMKPEAVIIARRCMFRLCNVCWKKNNIISFMIGINYSICLCWNPNVTGLKPFESRWFCCRSFCSDNSAPSGGIHTHGDMAASVVVRKHGRVHYNLYRGITTKCLHDIRSENAALLSTDSEKLVFNQKWDPIIISRRNLARYIRDV